MLTSLTSNYFAENASKKATSQVYRCATLNKTFRPQDLLTFSLQSLQNRNDLTEKRINKNFW